MKIKKENRLLYLIGLLGAVPFLGAITGAILLYQALFWQKDKLLAFIGAGGILVSIVFFGWLRYDMMYGKETGQAFSVLAKSDLDSLAIELKEFRRANGRYPDSLEQLQTMANYANIYDPLLGRRGGVNGKWKFNYHRNGDAYVLFSDGIDAVPNTSDDLYPDSAFAVPGPDSSFAYGAWRIEYMAFVAPPPTRELNEVVKACRNGRVVISATGFVFEASACTLLRTVKNFRITGQHTLRLDDTDVNVNYAPKTIDYLFDGGKRKAIVACKTSYTFEPNDGDVPELEIFIVDRSHIMINQGENLLCLKRD